MSRPAQDSSPSLTLLPMSLLDELEDTAALPPVAYLQQAPGPSSMATPIEPGYVSTAISSPGNLPMFTLDNVQFQFAGSLKALAVSNNLLAMATQSTGAGGSVVHKVYRIDLGQDNAVEEIEVQLKLKTDSIRKLFLDPAGKHLLIASDAGECLYLYERWKKPRLLSRFKNILVECIAWGKPRNPDITTGPILIGSRQGHIFETELTPSDEYFRKEERYLKQIYTLGDGSHPVVGLRFEKSPASDKKYFVIAATSNRLYQFVGDILEMQGDTPMFEALFRYYDLNAEYHEVPTDFGYSCLNFHSQYTDRDSGTQSVPKSFGWSSAPGVLYGNLVFGNQNVGDTFSTNTQLIPYPLRAGNDDPPICFAMTEFHFIFLFKTFVKCLCRLNNEVVFEEEIALRQGENVVGLAIDLIKNTYWIYTNLSLLELIVSDEDRNVWKMYLDKRNFDTAMSHAKTDAQRDEIVSRQAEYYFSQDRFQLSATYFAKSISIPFETIALKFVSKNQRGPLKKYLIEKLASLSPQSTTQQTLLCCWVLEMLIGDLNTSQNDIDSLNSKIADIRDGGAEPAALEEWSLKLARAMEEADMATDDFKAFVKSNIARIDVSVAYDIMISHGRDVELLYFAELIGDHDRVVTHWIQERQWLNALTAINNQPNLDLYYKFSPILIEHVPVDTVNAWIRHPDLSPKKLIPSLIKYESAKAGSQGTVNQAVRYLRYAVETLGETDTTVHNYLLSLYHKYASVDNEYDLLEFLRALHGERHYDLQYALRLCNQKGLPLSTIELYGALGLHELAVDKALQIHDIDLARIHADKPEDDDSLRRVLWLKIARHTVEEKQDIKTAMEVLRQCSLLKIEDILPFFPDFAVIDDFKEEICNALEEYNTHIDELKGQITEATKSSDNIREDIRGLRSRRVVIAANQTCQVCKSPVLSRHFYAFQCKHCYHADCLMNEVIKQASAGRAKQIQQLQESLTQELTIHQRVDRRQGNAPPSKLKQKALRRQLDEYVAAQCLLCGDYMIKTIDDPLVSSAEASADSWEI